jgi:hypothetical protein
MLRLGTDRCPPPSPNRRGPTAEGRAERLDHFPDIYAVEELPLFPWHPGYKGWFVRIRVLTLTGRRFTVVRGQRKD